MKRTRILAHILLSTHQANTLDECEHLVINALRTQYDDKALQALNIDIDDTHAANIIRWHDRSSINNIFRAFIEII